MLMLRKQVSKNPTERAARGRWTAVAACLCILIVGCVIAAKIQSGRSKDNQNVTADAYPYIMVNDILYLIDSDGYSTSGLPDEYVEIGRVEGNAPAEEAQNWFSQSCKQGELIYQGSDTSEVFVYTTLFSGEDEYRYLRFVQSGE